MKQSITALQFAREHHSGQTRKDGTPYIVHPLSMACYAVALGLRDDNVIATILLHDTVEDCGVRPEYLPVNDTVKRAVQYMTITKFDTDLDKILYEVNILRGILTEPILIEELDDISKSLSATGSNLGDYLKLKRLIVKLQAKANIPIHFYEALDDEYKQLYEEVMTDNFKTRK